MMRWLALLGLATLVGCDANDVRLVTEIYHPELTGDALDTRVMEMTRVMPFYVAGASLAIILMGVAILNALEHARQLGRGESVRFGAYILLLCFVGLFLAMSAQRSWLPAGYAGLAFGALAIISALATTIAARARPERAVLAVGYIAVSIAVPLTGLLLNGEIYLVDTTASLFIGFASGLLITIVLSDPVRSGLVDFLKKRDG